VILPLAAAAALLVGGSVAAWQFWPETPTAALPHPTPAVGATESTAVPTTTPRANATPSSTPKASASATPTANGAAVKAMDECRDRVRAADRVLEEAKPGIAHWEAHIKAQRDAERNAISAAEQQAIFKRTRLAGPSDQKRYADAANDVERTKGSCSKVDGADAAVKSAMAKCQQRSRAQKPVLAAADDVMRDWRKHLADMQRSRETHVKDAQRVWIRAYRAAPENINAYEKAIDNFDAPRC
jgi:hypothetical protein